MSDWYPRSGMSYQQFLQQKSFFDDVTRAQKDATRASVDAMGESTRKILGGMERSSERMAGGMAAVQGSIDELNASFRWDMGQVLGSLGGMADSLQSLIQIAKTPAQTAAYEQFEIARDAFRQQLYEESLEALDRAIGGDRSSPGYKLEWRFHQLVGVVKLGGLPGHDPAAAEQSFLLAARYARVDHKKEAARALLAAGWAAFVQENLPEALGHTEGALELNPSLGEALFQAAKVQMALDRPTDGLPVLRRAIDLDPLYLVKAGGDGAFVRHGPELEVFLEALRDEKLLGLQPTARDLLTKYQEVIRARKDINTHAPIVLLEKVLAGDRAVGLLDLLDLEKTMQQHVDSLERLEEEARRLEEEARQRQQQQLRAAEQEEARRASAAVEAELQRAARESEILRKRQEEAQAKRESNLKIGGGLFVLLVIVAFFALGGLSHCGVLACNACAPITGKEWMVCDISEDGKVETNMALKYRCDRLRRCRKSYIHAYEIVGKTSESTLERKTASCFGLLRLTGPTRSKAASLSRAMGAYLTCLDGATTKMRVRSCEEEYLEGDENLERYGVR